MLDELSMAARSCVANPKALRLERPMLSWNQRPDAPLFRNRRRVAMASNIHIVAYPGSPTPFPSANVSLAVCT